MLSDIILNSTDQQQQQTATMADDSSTELLMRDQAWELLALIRRAAEDNLQAAALQQKAQQAYQVLAANNTLRQLALGRKGTDVPVSAAQMIFLLLGPVSPYRVSVESHHLVFSTSPSHPPLKNLHLEDARTTIGLLLPEFPLLPVEDILADDLVTAIVGQDVVDGVHSVELDELRQRLQTIQHTCVEKNSLHQVSLLLASSWQSPTGKLESTADDVSPIEFTKILEAQELYFDRGEKLGFYSLFRRKGKWLDNLASIKLPTSSIVDKNSQRPLYTNDTPIVADHSSLRSPRSGRLLGHIGVIKNCFSPSFLQWALEYNFTQQTFQNYPYPTGYRFFRLSSSVPKAIFRIGSNPKLFESTSCTLLDHFFLRMADHLTAHFMAFMHKKLGADAGLVPDSPPVADLVFQIYGSLCDCLQAMHDDKGKSCSTPQNLYPSISINILLLVPSFHHR